MLSRIKSLCLSYLSKPASDRVIYRTIQGGKAHRILEIGIGRAERALRMINVAQQHSAGETVRYVAIDLFEGRPKDQPAGLSLREAHKLLKPTAAQTQLIPGEPAIALPRVANALQHMDLILLSAEFSEASLGGAWYYLPRMLHAGSAVFVETPASGAPGMVMRQMTSSEIEALASAHRPRRAA